ncbi:MAG: SET domain-containing protein [Actinomycetota bacterium]
MDNLLTHRAQSRETPGKGHGSFALVAIAAGEFVVCFGGRPTSFAEFSTYPAERRSRSLQIDHGTVVVGPPHREPGDSINHSCEPNLGFVSATRLVARRDIAAGEELTYDYATSDSAPYDEFDCACGSPQCRGRLNASDWMHTDVKRANEGWFSPYLARRIRALDSSRLLTKRDVETLMATVEVDPIRALVDATRVATGLRHATGQTSRAILHNHGVEVDEMNPASVDWAVAWFNETRGRHLREHQ